MDAMNKRGLLVGLSLLAGTAVVAGLAWGSARPNQGSSSSSGTSGSGNSGAASNAAQALPESIVLTGIARDFRERSVAGGHPDFQRQPTAGFGHYVGQVGPRLSEQGKPIFAGTGFRVNGARRDSKNREIMPIKSSFKLGDMVWEDGTDHDKGKGNDKPASGSASAPAPIEWDRSLVSASEGGSLTTAENFAQWFTDVPGVNVSIPVSITLKKAKDSNLYTFDDKTDDQFKPLGGFFPINRQGFGNSAGDNRNFHFTYEVATKFTYRKNSGQVFTFTGDDDVYVFVGGVLVIDLGGVHSAISQSVDLDTLDFLEDGQDYDLRLFFAERHRTQSNMRIETTIELRNAELPQTNSIFD